MLDFATRVHNHNYRLDPVIRWRKSSRAHNDRHRRFRVYARIRDAGYIARNGWNKFSRQSCPDELNAQNRVSRASTITPADRHGL
jgi:hypothetical protein